MFHEFTVQPFFIIKKKSIAELHLMGKKCYYSIYNETNQTLRWTANEEVTTWIEPFFPTNIKS